VAVIRKWFIGNRIHVSIIVLCKIQLDELTSFERVAIYRVRTVLLQPWDNIGEIKDGAFSSAYWMTERL